MYDQWRNRLRLIVGVCTALAAAGGALGALAAYTDYMPATRGFAKQIARLETDSALQVATARMGNLQREGTETRLQINQLRRETLRNAKWNRTEELKKELDVQTRQFLQAQLDQIGDDLRDVDAERDRLRAFSVP